MEHGHGNDRSDMYYSCCFWYQDKPATSWPQFPPVGARIPTVKAG
jgi:hypothetical protein